MAMATAAISAQDSATMASVNSMSLVYSSNDLWKCASVKAPALSVNALWTDSPRGTRKKTAMTSRAGPISSSPAQRRFMLFRSP
jgi:hypothetical protein